MPGPLSQSEGREGEEREDGFATIFLGASIQPRGQTLWPLDSGANWVEIWAALSSTLN